MIIEMAFQYTTEQCAGQRKSKIISWIGPPPERGSEVFVSNIPRNIFEGVLAPVFLKVGVVFEFRLMMDFSGSNRGFAFVKYANRDQARAAVKHLNQYEIQGHNIYVTLSVDNCRLFMRNLPLSKTSIEFLEELKVNVDGVASVLVYKRTGDQKKNFAVVEFESHQAAAMARRALVPGSVKLFGDTVQAEWTDRRSRFGVKQLEAPIHHAAAPAPFVQHGNKVPETTPTWNKF